MSTSQGSDKGIITGAIGTLVIIAGFIGFAILGFDSTSGLQLLGISLLIAVFLMIVSRVQMKQEVRTQDQQGSFADGGGVLPGLDLARISDAFGDTGLEGEEILGVIEPATEELAQGVRNHNWYLIFTNKRVGIFEREIFKVGSERKWIKTLKVKAHNMKAIESIGIGESKSTKSDLVSRSYMNYLTMTVKTLDGDQYERHVLMGDNEDSSNSNRKYFLNCLGLMEDAGYNLIDGNSYTKDQSITYSVGFLREIGGN